MIFRIRRINVWDAILIGFIVNGCALALIQVILFTLSAFVQSIRTSVLTFSVNTCMLAFVYDFAGAIIGGLLWGFFTALYNFAAAFRGGIQIDLEREKKNQ